jgi:hypothetical protein
MTAGKNRDIHENPDLSKPARDKGEPVSLPENADFRYDEQEALDPGAEDDARDTKPEA